MECEEIVITRSPVFQLACAYIRSDHYACSDSLALCMTVGKFKEVYKLTKGWSDAHRPN